MNPAAFSLVSIFPAVGGDAKSLSHFGGAELALFALAKRAQTVHRRADIAVHSDGIGIPEMLKLLWLKSPIRSKPAVFIY